MAGMTPTRTTARSERQTAADAAGGRGSGGVFRIILVGATGLEASIAACGGVETVRVETPFEAIGEAADAALSQTGLTHKQKKKRRDAIAAAAICRAYLENPDAARIDTLPEGENTREGPKPG